MTNKYKYGNQDIYYLLNSTGASNSGSYIGFPISNVLNYKSRIAFPKLLNYQINGIDLSNSNQAYTIDFPAFSSSVDITYNISRIINGISFKHISAYCIGGSGGGGGGSGGAKGPPSHSGGKGAPGAQGGYAAIVQYPLGNSNISLTLGAWGKIGVEGNTGSKSGNDGTPGGVGGATNLTIDNLLLSASGGGGGNAGNNGNSGGDGNAGTTQPTAASNVFANGYTSTTVSPSDAVVWPLNTSVAGIGGIGGAGDGTPAATAGTHGTAGSAQLWFSYQA